MTGAPNDDGLIESNYDQICENFDQMDLKENLLRGIYSHGFEKPSAIQQRAIVPACTGRDLIAQAQSGTGKTGTFSISVLQRVDENEKAIQALVLAPTRELAQQIHKVMTALANYQKIKIHSCVGGTAIRDDHRAFESGDVQVVVGTPGRVHDMIERGHLATDKIKMFVLDEADEMLSRGFKDQIYEIFKTMPTGVQVFLLSATLPADVLEVTKKFMRDPIRILVKKEELTLEGIIQYYVDVGKEEHKLDVLLDLYGAISVTQAVIFANTRRRVEELQAGLTKEKYTVSAIHGDMAQAERENIMRAFRSGSSRILITTDLLARGIDVQQVSLVINYDLPINRENYIHRIGRSGRFGRKGVAINFITPNDKQQIDDIQTFYNTLIDELPDGLEQLLAWKRISMEPSSSGAPGFRPPGGYSMQPPNQLMGQPMMGDGMNGMQLQMPYDFQSAPQGYVPPTNVQPLLHLQMPAMPGCSQPAPQHPAGAQHADSFLQMPGVVPQSPTEIPNSPGCGGPIRKRRFSSAKIQPTRIKKVMQSDEEIGRMVASVPVAIGRAMEHFAEKFLQASSAAMAGLNGRTLNTAHMKMAVLANPHYRFLEPIFKDIALPLKHIQEMPFNVCQVPPMYQQGGAPFPPMGLGTPSPSSNDFAMGMAFPNLSQIPSTSMVPLEQPVPQQAAPVERRRVSNGKVKQELAPGEKPKRGRPRKIKEEKLIDDHLADIPTERELMPPPPLPIMLPRRNGAQNVAPPLPSENGIKLEHEAVPIEQPLPANDSASPRMARGMLQRQNSQDHGDDK
ncbi:unnamed protein product, partial [Mesorhabditis spiculigera]